MWWIYVNSKSWHQDISSGVSEFLPILGNFNINVNFKKIVELASKWIYEETFSQLTCWVCDRGTTPTIHYNPRISSKWEKHQKLIPIFLNIAKNKKFKKKNPFFFQLISLWYQWSVLWYVQFLKQHKVFKWTQEKEKKIHSWKIQSIRQ